MRPTVVAVIATSGHGCVIVSESAMTHLPRSSFPPNRNQPKRRSPSKISHADSPRRRSRKTLPPMVTRPASYSMDGSGKRAFPVPSPQAGRSQLSRRVTRHRHAADDLRRPGARCIRVVHGIGRSVDTLLNVAEHGLRAASRASKLLGDEIRANGIQGSLAYQLTGPAHRRKETLHLELGLLKELTQFTRRYLHRSRIPRSTRDAM